MEHQCNLRAHTYSKLCAKEGKIFVNANSALRNSSVIVDAADF